MISGKLQPSSEAISEAVYDWLEAEVATSSNPEDVNAVLNDYTSAIAGLHGGFEHPKNFTWNKAQSHISRLNSDFEIFADTLPNDKYYDKIAAKIIFDGLMQVSGSYRNQCYVEARDAEDYIERRQKAIGLNIANTVRNRLIDLVPQSGDFSSAKISVESLGERVKQVSQLGETAVKRLCSRAALGYDFGTPGSRSAQEMISAQYNWLNFALDSLILVAKYKDGDIAAVPFLEPISITEQSGSLYYPLAAPVNWAEVLAADKP